MVKLDDAVIARFESHGHKFEVLVDPDMALNFRKGEQVNFNEMLAIDTVFKDSAKGEEAGEGALEEVFKSTEIETVVKKIILDGEVQLTTDQRKRMKEERIKEVIDIISKNAVNPQNNAPHPPKRIENALEEAKINIQAEKSAEEQVPEILEEIKKLIPISFEKLSIAVKIPAEFAGKASNTLRSFTLKKEEWQNDGSLIAVVEIPAGLKQDLFNELNHITHGDIETKILEK